MGNSLIFFGNDEVLYFVIYDAQERNFQLLFSDVSTPPALSLVNVETFAQDASRWSLQPKPTIKKSSNIQPTQMIVEPNFIF